MPITGLFARGVLMLAIALAATVTTRGARRPQPAGGPTAAIVERAGRYVEAYHEAFSAVVSEERQVQTLVRPDGRVRQVRELRSDFLLVKTATGSPQAFPWTNHAR